MHRRVVMVAAALVLLAGACGKGGTDEKAGTIAHARRTTTTSSTTPSTDATTTTTTVAGGVSKTAVAGATATTAKGTPAAAAAPTATTADPNAVPGPAAPGTYTYAQSGSTSQGSPPGTGTLVVSGGGPSQVFARHVDGSNEGDLYFTFTSHGPVITKVVLKQNGIAINCSFASPVPAPPWPPTAGSHFSGHATCDNGFTADFSGSVGGHVTDHVAGTAVDAVVISSTLHASGQVLGQPVEVTVNDTQHWAPSLRVPTYSHEVISGQVSGDVTSTLLNTSPH
ncbi:MAG TPA: hypothetical protein VHD87_07635 [Acidimicrobiales bacterium]|nr:hypothetical protein [Acidimicrobiales bacterium]